MSRAEVDKRQRHAAHVCVLRHRGKNASFKSGCISNKQATSFTSTTTTQPVSSDQTFHSYLDRSPMAPKVRPASFHLVLAGTQRVHTLSLHPLPARPLHPLRAKHLPRPKARRRPRRRQARARPRLVLTARRRRERRLARRPTRLTSIKASFHVAVRNRFTNTRCLSAQASAP